MSDKYVLDGDGNPIPADLMTWAKWFGVDTNRIVERTEIGDVRVSTVFLGLDHGFGLSELPVLWETMIFGGLHDGYQDRYTSRDAAVEGHARALALVNATVSQ